MRTAILIFVLPFILCTSRFTYEDAAKRGTIDAYYRFVSENPDAPETEQAISNIRDILFTAALQKKDIVLIKRFLSDFPNDPRAKTLLDLLDEIRFEEARKKNTKAAYEIFIRTAANGKLRDEARNLIQDIEYSEIKDSDDIPKLEAFLKRNKSGIRFQEVKSRLEKILFEKIKKGDVYFAEPFLRRFPDSEKEAEITEILLADITDRLDNLCLFEWAEKLAGQTGAKIKNPAYLNAVKEKSEVCTKNYAVFSSLASQSLKKGEEKRIFFENYPSDYRANALTLLKNYHKNLEHIIKIQDDIASEDAEKRRMAYLELKYYPFSLKTASLFAGNIINGTILEKLELADILRERLRDENDRRIFNFLFFVNRDKPVYPIYRTFFFEYPEDFESDNLFLNKTFSDAKEDIFLQFMLIDYAYQRGYNSFIRSVMNDHLKQLFTLTSEYQSLCQQECSKKILFELKGVSQMLLREEEMAKVLFGENSDVFGIIKEKRSELSKTLDKHKFILEQPFIQNPSEKLSFVSLVSVREKTLLKFVCQAEPNREKRDKIRELIKKKD